MLHRMYMQLISLILAQQRKFFFNCYLATPHPTWGHYWGGSLTHPMLSTCILHIQPEGHQEPQNKVGSLSPAKHLVEFEPRTFWFWSQCLNPLGHSPQMSVKDRNFTALMEKECSKEGKHYKLPPPLRGHDEMFPDNWSMAEVRIKKLQENVLQKQYHEDYIRLTEDMV